MCSVDHDFISHSEIIFRKFYSRLRSVYCLGSIHSEWWLNESSLPADARVSLTKNRYFLQITIRWSVDSHTSYKILEKNGMIVNIRLARLEGGFADFQISLASYDSSETSLHITVIFFTVNVVMFGCITKIIFFLFFCFLL